MKARRTVLAGMTAAALCPLGANAEARVPRVGLLGHAPDWAPFHRQVRELGYTEGKSIAFELRHALDGTAAKMAADLVALDVDAIVAGAAPYGLAAKRATSRIPIIVVRMADPIGLGLVASLARPGANVTGFTTQSAELGPKRLEFLREMLPDMKRLVLLGTLGNPAFPLSVEEVRQAARAAGVAIIAVAAGPGEPIRALRPVLDQRPDALMVLQGFVESRFELTAFALEHRLPAIYLVREFSEAGGLVSYGPSYADLFRRSALYLDKILKGASPADLPVEQPTKFELVLNLKTAKAMSFTFPAAFLVRADAVIE
jgi:putative ABC transport system substrate-binding protein